MLSLVSLAYKVPCTEDLHFTYPIRALSAEALRLTPYLGVSRAEMLHPALPSGVA